MVSSDLMLDPAALQRLRDLDPSGASRLVERVFQAFQSSVERLLVQLRNAQVDNDTEAVRHVAHTLKSSSASIGAVKLSQICVEVESMARQGRTDGLSGRVAELSTEVEAVLVALKNLPDSHP